MADNITLPGAGLDAATDDVAGKHYQRIKLSDGTPDSSVHARVVADNPGALDGGLVVRQAPEDVWQASFSNVNGSALDEPNLTQRRLGTGMAVSQSGGNLVLTTGTTANSEFLARSNDVFNGAMIVRHKTILSQRIANNNFVVMLADRIGEGLSCTINSATSISVTLTAHGFTAVNIGQFVCVGAISGANGVPGRFAIASIPDANTINFTVAGWPASGSCTVDLFGRNYIRTLYDSTTATQCKVDAQRNGWASGDTTATINTTVSPGHVMQMHADGRNIYWADTLVATTVTPTVVVRATRVEIMPDDDANLYVYLWAYNGSTSPASTTTWTVGFVSVEDLANVPVYVAGFRPHGFAAPLPVVFPAAQAVSGTVTANIGTGSIAAGTAAIGDVGIQYRASATGAGTPTVLNSPATPAVQTIKGSAGRLVGYHLINTGTLKFLKVFNIVSPTLGTSSATLDIPLPQNVNVTVSFGGGIAFGTAITCAITGARGLTDNTAITANEVTGYTLHA
jgi:hypothetical protein